jgi:hypothetical protein
MGISLGLLTLIFSQGANWAWLAIWAIGAFWLSCCLILYAASRGSRKAKGASK